MQASTDTVAEPSVAKAQPIVLMDAAVSAYIAHKERVRLATLRDEFVKLSTHGKYHSAAAAEWKGLPMEWRIVLLMVAGVGADADDLSPLAARNWQEFPPPERDAIRSTVRHAKKHVATLTALAAKV